MDQATPRDVREQRLAPFCELDKWCTVVLVSLGLCPWMVTTHSCVLIPSSGLFLGEPDVTLPSLAFYLGVEPLPGLPIAHICYGAMALSSGQPRKRYSLTCAGTGSRCVQVLICSAVKGELSSSCMRSTLSSASILHVTGKCSLLNASAFPCSLPALYTILYSYPLSVIAHLCTPGDAVVGTCFFSLNNDMRGLWSVQMVKRHPYRYLWNFFRSNIMLSLDPVGRTAPTP